MSKKSNKYSPDIHDNQHSDKVNTKPQQQNGHAPNLVKSSKIENFSSSASSSEEVERVPDVKVSNIIGNVI